MLSHHDSRPYPVAAKEAGERARVIINNLIDKGKTNGTKVLTKVLEEIPSDTLAKGSALQFTVKDKIKVAAGNQELSIHPHALTQLASKINMPDRYIKHLMDSGDTGRDVLGYSLQKLFSKDESRHLLRSVKGELRGFLSDRYRRFHSGEVLESFVEAATKIGAVPIDGHALDTKFALKVMLSDIYEPATGEVVAFGMMLQNSDYGDGALSIQAFCMRLWCTNLAIAEQNLRRVHLGKRLEEDVTWSNETYKADAKTMSLMVTDVCKTLPERVEKYCDDVHAASSEEIDVAKVLGGLRRDGRISKSEEEDISKTFNTPDVEALPPGNTRWRLSNAISFFAKKEEDEKRLLALEGLAGKVLWKD